MNERVTKIMKYKAVTVAIVRIIKITINNNKERKFNKFAQKINPFSISSLLTSSGRPVDWISHPRDPDIFYFLFLLLDRWKVSDFPYHFSVFFSILLPYLFDLQKQCNAEINKMAETIESKMQLITIKYIK